MSLLPISAIPVVGGYNINNSLRFRSSASAYLSRTPASAGSRTTWTISFWIKLSDLASSVDIFSAGGAGTETELRYGYNTLGSFSFSVNGTTTFVSTTALRRDPSSWYHIVVVANTTSATSTERFKLYVNNELQTFTTATQPAQNTSMGWNNNVLHYIGRRVGATSYFDGYIAEFHSIDGQALTPSSFGSTNANTGVWQPKAYTGTYGTNGFYLQFSDNSALTTTSNVGLGKDFSGNSNYWTTNNISVTSGTTYDSMTDVPTLTSATVSNYCVVNPLTIVSGNTISNGNLTISGTGTTYNNTSTIAVTSGKWYYEVSVPSAGNYYIGIGTSDGQAAKFSSQYVTYRSGTGNKNITGTQTAYGATYTTGDTIGVAFDLDAGTIEFYKNNSNQGSISLPSSTINSWYPVMYVNGTIHLNFGQQPFTYTPPTGFNRLNTYNLPDSTIKKGNSYMDATLWTGTGSGITITNAGGFKPDLVWYKHRNGTRNNLLFDSVRGTTKYLQSNSTLVEQTDAQSLTSFNSNGFTLGTNGNGATNGETYVGWQWQSGQGTTSSNTQGSITSTVSVNATAGFSIVTYTGTGANATVGHGLGVAPKMVIVKDRSDSQGWAVYHSSLANTQFLLLNSTAAAATGATYWNSTSPTSTVFSIGTIQAVNKNTDLFVAYCFAEIAGFSAFGSYTGNGSTDGPFVYLGFRPKFILIKRTITAGSSWFIIDSTRNTYNVTNLGLSPDTSGVEFTGATTTIPFYDMYSNGFKVRGTSSGMNSATDTYIYAAFAENPFKYSLAR